MSGAANLDDFLHDPGAWAESSLVAAQVAPGLQAETVRRLMASPRLGARASRILASQLGAPDSAPFNPQDARLVLASFAQLQAVASAAGAVWHGRRVRALLRGQEIAALTERFGPQLREAALAHAPPDTAPETTDDLAADIERDGQACLIHWLATLPAWAAARLRLVHAWPHGPAAPDPARVALFRLLGAARL